MDKDGTVCMQDLMVLPNKLLGKGEVEESERLREQFKEYYVRVCQSAGYPGDQGSLVKEDWIKGAVGLVSTEWYRQEFLPGIMDVYFKTLDLDRDGKLSPSEWEQFYRSRGIEDKEFCARTFEKMNAKGDGFISPEEFKYGFIEMALEEDPTKDFSFLYHRKK